MDLNRLYINFNALSIPTQWQMTKAKRAYVKTHPVCAVCGNTKYLEVHHCLPVHNFPAVACDPNNFITLCDGPNNCSCHKYQGHFGNFKSCYNPYIREYAIISRLMMIYSGNKSLITDTKQLIHEFARAKKMSIELFLLRSNTLIDINALNTNQK